uniref:TOG domain-containing protein n=1 Tax=Romanomermis culicivorax TaxID=13658 RepID=A0A915I281_ROMCU
MDVEVDNICKVLVPKTGDTSNAFIRDDALRALECMVDFSSPKRSLAALTAIGANHKNSVVRSACAQLIRRLVENLGAESCLKEQPREFGEKLINALTKFAADSQPQPRMHGKAALALLALSGKEFQQFIGENFNDQQRKNISKVSVNMDSGKASANSSAAGSRQSSMTRNNSMRRKLTKISENDAQDLSNVCSLLTSSDWESRADGLDKFTQLSSSCPDHLAKNPKILEAYTQRLNDINSKVAYQALTDLPKIISDLKVYASENGLRPMINDMMRNLSAQLPSKNEENRQLALQGFVEAIKSFDICQNLLEQGKIKLTVMNAMPVLADLLKNYNQDLNSKYSTNAFIEQLHKQMGRKTFLDACSNLPIQQKTLLTILFYYCIFANPVLLWPHCLHVLAQFSCIKDEEVWQSPSLRHNMQWAASDLSYKLSRLSMQESRKVIGPMMDLLIRCLLDTLTNL